MNLMPLVKSVLIKNHNFSKCRPSGVGFSSRRVGLISRFRSGSHGGSCGRSCPSGRTFGHELPHPPHGGQSAQSGQWCPHSPHSQCNRSTQRRRIQDAVLHRNRHNARKESLLDLLEGICDLVFLSQIRWKAISLIVIPINTLLRSFLIVVVNVGNIKLAVIVFRIVISVFPSSAIVSCQIQYASRSFLHF